MVAGGCVVDSVGPTTETFSVEGRDVGELAMVKVRLNQYHMYIHISWGNYMCTCS